MMNVNALFALLVFLLLAGCSLPRIIVLNDPLDAQQHNDLGVAYEQRGEYDLALREYGRAAGRDKDWALPLFNSGNVHARLEQWPAAVAAYEAALKLDGRALPLMNNLAWALVQIGESRRGLSLAEEVVGRDGTDPGYWDTLAAAYQAAGRPEDAAQAARRGLLLDPSPELSQALRSRISGPP
ncbi:MAG TPA: tetratricopeptide repeat protein [Geopsychrobacteraceae bacterium]|jgi:tetratricopeptide (TPR) repeat protein